MNVGVAEFLKVWTHATSEGFIPFHGRQWFISLGALTCEDRSSRPVLLTVLLFRVDGFGSQLVFAVTSGLAKCGMEGSAVAGVGTRLSLPNRSEGSISHVSET